MNESQQRRAVFTGMRPFLKDDELIAALEVWQDKYVGKPKVEFTQFLSESCRSKEIRGKRSAILSSIFNSLTLPEDELLPDPLNLKTNRFEFSLEQQETRIETNVVFSAFFQTLLTQLEDGPESHMRQYLVESCDSNFNINAQQMLALKTWLSGVSDVFEVAFHIDDKRKLVNLAYVAMCQHIGPVKADQLLSASIKKTEPFAIEHQVNLHIFL